MDVGPTGNLLENIKLKILHSTAHIVSGWIKDLNVKIKHGSIRKMLGKILYKL